MARRASSSRSRSARQLLSSGPWRGVKDTTDPFDDRPDFLTDAINGYIPDPDAPSGFYGRPGFLLLNNGTAIYTSASAFRGQAIYTHVALDGTAYNFAVVGGHVVRADSTFTTFTDVSPVGITIDSGITTRVSMVSLAGQLVVSDGVNRPWIAGNLNSTPITGTYIDFDGAGTTWSAQHVTVYSGGILFLLNQLNSVYAKTDIAWSAPGDPSVGYQQTNYDYRWTLEQTGSSPIFAVHGTNVGLYYFRERSIGLAAGALGPDFQTSHTDDAISFNVGTRAPQTIQGFGDRLFFCDAIGRPWMLPLGGTPVPIWQNLRAIVDTSSTQYPTITAVTSTSAFEPTLNLYVVGIWSPTPSNQSPVTQWFTFDARTGAYQGRWNVTSAAGTPVGVECLGTFLDNHGRASLIVLGSKDAAPATGGYLWSFSALGGVPDYLSTEALSVLTTEASTKLIAEGQAEIWMDNGVTPSIAVTTPRMGYSDTSVWNVDQATVITGNTSAVTVTLQTATTAASVEGTPVPSASSDGTYRLVVGADVQGRGTQATVSPTTTDTQWSIQRVTLLAVPSLAGPEDG